MEDKSFLRHINSVSPYGSSHKHFCLPTSFKALDDIIGGFACGSLVAIAGLPGARQDNFLYSMLINWVDTCFDADRLDLMRVGITPDTEKMATERGRYYAANLEQFYADTKINDEDLPF